MSVTADVETRSRQGVVTVPFQSVTTRLPQASRGSNPDSSESESKFPRPKDGGKKGRQEANKPIEVVFVVEEGTAKMVPVERGISDDNYVEIVSGLEAGQEVVSGSYKAIAEDLEDGKKVSPKDDSERGDSTENGGKP